MVNKMSVRRIMVYALAGEEYKGGIGGGFIGTLIDCLFDKSLEPFRKYSRLVRERITEERLRNYTQSER